MSFIDAIKKKSKLSAAVKLITDARKSEGSRADQMYKSIYQDFAEVINGDPLRAEALYMWGFALLHQAKTKSGAEAIKIYQEAITRFSFCLMIEPNYLGAAIDGGVACMDLARCKAASLNDELYDKAKSYFEKANAIQAGSASYNLACIYGLLGVKDECLASLETAKNRGSLPDANDILADPDLKNVKNQAWFLTFMESLQKKPEPESEPAVTEAVKPETVTAEKSVAKESVETKQAPVETVSEETGPGDIENADEEIAEAEAVAAANIDESAFAGQHFRQ